MNLDKLNTIVETLNSDIWEEFDRAGYHKENFYTNSFSEWIEFTLDTNGTCYIIKFVGINLWDSESEEVDLEKLDEVLRLRAYDLISGPLVGLIASVFAPEKSGPFIDLEKYKNRK